MDDKEGTQVCVVSKGGRLGRRRRQRWWWSPGWLWRCSQGSVLGTGGGLQSTEMCMGNVLVRWLDRSGIRFYRVDDVGKELEGVLEECVQKSKSLHAHL